MTENINIEATVKQSPREKLVESLDQGDFTAWSNHAASTKARQTFGELDFPTTRMEAWKYTRTTRLQNVPWSIQPSNISPEGSEFSIPGLNALRIVFVNGFYRSDLSDTRAEMGLVLSPEPSSEPGGNEFENGADFFSTMNEGYCNGRFLVEVAEGAQLEMPLQLCFIQTGQDSIALPRIQVRCANHSRLVLITSFHSHAAKKTFINAHFDVEIGMNASLDWTKLQLEKGESSSITREWVNQQQDSRLNIRTITVDGEWVRNDLQIRLSGTNCETFLSGVYMPRDQQLVDNHTMVDHRMPHCNSNELYKGVVFDSARAVFNGKVFVRKDAQKTNAFQSNGNILMSDQAIVDSKPELEIYADDVKCSHGSTTGQLDDEAMFYLRARGLGFESARKLLLTAFVNEVLETIEHEAIQHFVRDQFIQRGLLIE